MSNTLRFYLNKKGVDNLKEEEGKAESTNLMNLEVKTGRDREKYIQIYADPTSPIAKIPRIGKYTKEVSLSSTYDAVISPDGLYEDKGAKAQVKTLVIDTGQGCSRSFQSIDVSARSFKALVSIYRKILNGELSPTELWSGRGR